MSGADKRSTEGLLRLDVSGANPHTSGGLLRIPQKGHLMPNPYDHPVSVDGD